MIIGQANNSVNIKDEDQLLFIVYRNTKTQGRSITTSTWRTLQDRNPYAYQSFRLELII